MPHYLRYVIHGVGFARCNKFELKCANIFLELESGWRIGLHSWLRWCDVTKLPLLFAADRILTRLKEDMSRSPARPGVSQTEAELLLKLVQCEWLSPLIASTTHKVDLSKQSAEECVFHAFDKKYLEKWVPFTKRLIYLIYEI